LALDQDVDQQPFRRPLAFRAPERSDQHYVGFHMAVVALDKGRADQLHPAEIDSLDYVGPGQCQQVPNVLGVLEQQLDGVFPELAYNLQNPRLDHTCSFPYYRVPRYRCRVVVPKAEVT
jgi:hypothetical protein